MSMFSWFSRKPPTSKPRPAAAHDQPSGLLNADATVPLMPGRASKPMAPAAPPEHAANRKNERMERRELLYTVVRDAMVRAGVLSAGYKFKVLSLDQRGRQFLVMIDLAREYGGETIRLSEIEALIAQTAKTRFDILVTAVYWRINDHVAVGVPQRPLGTHAPAPAHHAAPPRAVPVPAASAPSPIIAPPVAAAVSRPAPLVPPRVTPVPTVAPAPPALTPAAPPTVAAPAPRTAPRYEPIEADEVAAFKRALVTAAASKPQTPVAAPGVAVRSGPLLPAAAAVPTGFEDTEMPEQDSREGRSPDLSTTQYGEL